MLVKVSIIITIINIVYMINMSISMQGCTQLGAYWLGELGFAPFGPYWPAVHDSMVSSPIPYGMYRLCPDCPDTTPGLR